MTRSSRSTCALACALLFAACGDPDSDTGPAASVEGTITYEGTTVGDLQIAVFSSFPPRGEPVTVVRIERPVFPYHYNLDRLPPGRYYVLAMIDADPSDGDNFRPTRDPGGAVGGYVSPQSVTVSFSEPIARGDIELRAPSADSPYVTRGYR